MGEGRRGLEVKVKLLLGGRSEREGAGVCGQGCVAPVSNVESTKRREYIQVREEWPSKPASPSPGEARPPAPQTLHPLLASHAGQLLPPP